MKPTIVKKYIENYYPNITKIKKISRLRHIDLNSINYLVVSEKENYVLHNFVGKYTAKKIEDVCKVLRFCRYNDVKVSEPIPRKNGKFVDKKNRFYLTKYYVGRFYADSIEELRDLSMNLANLHKVLSTYSGKFIYENNNESYKMLNNLELEKISQIIKTKPKLSIMDKKMSKNISFIIECIKKDALELKIIKKYPSKEQLIHSDLHTKNVIFNNGKVTAIIDFNSLRRGKIEEDLAFSSYRFSAYKKNSPSEIKNRIKIFLATYRKYHKIDTHIMRKASYYFRHMTLQRLCYIIRMHYFVNSDLWISDFDKHLNLLKLQKDIEMF